MNVIHTFIDKKREKQIKYERGMLRDLSIQMLKRSVQNHFGSSRLTANLVMTSGIEEACFDIAIESYLLGARMSRFGFYGENLDQVKQRCEEELQHLSNTFYNFLLYWGHGGEGAFSETLKILCEQYVESWWNEGFNKGERRHKLRLH